MIFKILFSYSDLANEYISKIMKKERKAPPMNKSNGDFWRFVRKREKQAMLVLHVCKKQYKRNYLDLLNFRRNKLKANLHC
jgi:hypothetical protein